MCVCIGVYTILPLLIQANKEKNLTYTKYDSWYISSKVIHTISSKIINASSLSVEHSLVTFIIIINCICILIHWLAPTFAIIDISKTVRRDTQAEDFHAPSSVLGLDLLSNYDLILITISKLFGSG